MLGGLVVVGGLANRSRCRQKDGLASVQRVARINGAVLLTHVMRAIITTIMALATCGRQPRCRDQVLDAGAWFV